MDYKRYTGGLTFDSERSPAKGTAQSIFNGKFTEKNLTADDKYDYPR